MEQPQGTVEKFAVRELFDGQHPGQNIVIHAGAQIRVPQCQQVFVVGDGKRPGAFPFLSVGDTTVLQLLALRRRARCVQPQQGIHLPRRGRQSRQTGD